eukprot:jgi/Astpho2/7153/Aster-01477
MQFHNKELERGYGRYHAKHYMGVDCFWSIMSGLAWTVLTIKVGFTFMWQYGLVCFFVLALIGLPVAAATFGKRELYLEKRTGLLMLSRLASTAVTVRLHKQIFFESEATSMATFLWKVVVGSKMLLLVNNTFGCQLKFPEHLLMQLISWGLVLSSNPELCCLPYVSSVAGQKWMNMLFHRLVMKARNWSGINPFGDSFQFTDGNECILVHAFLQTAFGLLIPTWVIYLSDVVTRRSYAAQVRQVAEDSNDEDTFRICSRFLAQTSTPRLVYGLMLMPMTVLLWRFLELLDVLAAKGYLKPTLSLVDR